MRFSLAWADVASQNAALKVALGTTCLVCIILAVAVSNLSSREPLLIDRGCTSRAVNTVSSPHTKDEVKAFTEAALHQRFDSDSAETAFLSEREKKFKNEEQQKLSSASMNQRIVIRQVTAKDGGAHVEADRLLAAGDVRSALVFPLNVELSKISRSVANPYGLLLLAVTPVKKEEKR